MLPADLPFILLDDARAAGAAPARLYAGPKAVLRASTPDELDALLAAVQSAGQSGLHAAGYFSYEAGLALEPRLRPLLPARTALPLAWFGLFERYDEFPPDAVKNLLPDGDAQLTSLDPHIDKGDYAAIFAKVQDYIRSGDIYQANLTLAASAHYTGSPLSLYAALRGRAAAGHGGIVYDGTHWFLSFSPELFFALKDRRVTTRPMKGTAMRSADSKADQLAAQTLRSSAKQRAENLMIVDLLRNDLSRVAATGSVTVPDLFTIETYPTIHQMTSTIVAQLDEGRDATDLIRAIFPCGSITGAPKIRAMEIIAALERRERGIYCGSIGRIDANGDAAFNVAIRTFCLSEPEKTLSVGLGSGVVADSNAADEWAECMAKGDFAKMADSIPAGKVETGSAPVVFDLIETMLFEPAEGIFRLEEHLARMKASARKLGFEFDRHATRNALQVACFHIEKRSRIRLLLSSGGATALEIAPAPEPEAKIWHVALVPTSLPSHDDRRNHKTTARAHYDGPRIAATGADEVVFVDADGYLTEGSFTSIFVEGEDGILLTPPVERGLLPGVLRQQLIEEGRAVARDLTPDALANGFFVGNSLRGLIPARLVAGVPVANKDISA